MLVCLVYALSLACEKKLIVVASTWKCPPILSSPDLQVVFLEGLAFQVFVYDVGF